MLDRIQAQLPPYLADAVPAWADPAVEDLANINAGWESDVYAFTLVHGPDEARQRERLILRIYPGDQAERVARRESAGMRALWRAGYPLPQVHAACPTDSPLGRPFMVMSFVEGEILWDRMVRPADPGVGEELLTRYCRVFADLHALDWRAVASEEQVARYEADPFQAVDDQLTQAQRAVDQWGLHDMAPVIDWMAERRRGLGRALPAPVHLDLHPGNVLLRPDGGLTVIDWTQVQAADLRFDLAWTAVLVGSHESRDWRDRIVAGYERARGEPLEDVDLFEVFSAIKRLGSVAVTLSQGAGTVNMRPGAEAMIRRALPALERVYAHLTELTGLRVGSLDALFAAGHHA